MLTHDHHDDGKQGQTQRPDQTTGTVAGLSSRHRAMKRQYASIQTADSLRAAGPVRSGPSVHALLMSLAGSGPSGQAEGPVLHPRRRSCESYAVLAAPDFDGVGDVVDGLPQRVVDGDRPGVGVGMTGSPAVSM